MLDSATDPGLAEILLPGASADVALSYSTTPFEWATALLGLAMALVILPWP